MTSTRRRVMPMWRCCGVLLLGVLLIPHGATFTPRQSQAMRDEVSEPSHPLRWRGMHTSGGLLIC